jgi:hypothetical protein
MDAKEVGEIKRFHYKVGRVRQGSILVRRVASQ